MTPVVLGDLLQLAASALSEAAAGPGIGERPDRRELAATLLQAHRLTAAMARFADDVAGEGGTAADRGPLTSAWRQAADDARSALRHAEENLAHVTEYFGARDPQPQHTPASHLGQAARLLAAGRDLLQTHFPGGAPSSTWSAAICSPQANQTLLNELGSWCRLFSPVADQLSIARPRPKMPHPIRENLNAVRRCLMAADLTIRWAAERTPVTASDRQLLAAVPVHVLPGRLAPYAGETVPQLCEGIAVSAERLRISARQHAADAQWSPLVTAASWHWTATAAAITHDACGIILRSAAEGARHFGLAAELAGQVYDASVVVGDVRRHWLIAAEAWDIVTTDAQGRVSPIVPDVSDMLVRAGRLAFANPAWTPRSTHRAPPRAPGDLIADGPALVAVITAAHHAVDGLARAADSDVQAIFGAARGGRLYQSRLTLPGWQRARERYVPATQEATDRLLDSYQATARAARRAAAALDVAARAVDAPSVYLSMARAAHEPKTYTTGDLAFSAKVSPALPASPEESRIPAKAGPIQRKVERLGISDKHIRLRAALIDQSTEILKEEVELALHARHPSPISAAGVPAVGLERPPEARVRGPAPRR
jgi:hypothetical protein